MKLASILVLVVAARATTYSRHSLERLAYSSVEPAPAPAPASPAAPGAAAVAAVQVTFEIKNINYFDLTKETCPEIVGQEESSKAKSHKAKGKKARNSGKPTFGEAVEEIDQHVDDVTASLAHAEKPPPPPWMDEDAADPKVPLSSESADSDTDHDSDTDIDVEREKTSLLSTAQTGVCVVRHNSLGVNHSQSSECKTVMDVFRSAITEVVEDVIKCVGSMPVSTPSAPSAAPAPSAVPLPGGLVHQPRAFLQSIQPVAPASASQAPAPVESHARAAIHVTFSPGTEVGSGRSVIVEITLTDTPSNGLDDVALIKAIIERAREMGLLKRELKTALAIVTGIWPKLGKISVKTTSVEGWDVKRCEGHVKKIVQQFSHHYTREQVPLAMLNECTNFMTRMSFSNDHVLDPVDTLVCRKTTESFAKHWNYGEKAKDEDFQLMCVRACEAKFGNKAPQCHVEAGDKLAGKPLL